MIPRSWRWCSPGSCRIRPSSATQSSRSSRIFHTRPSRPRGTSTRATSGTARPRSTQCHAWATSTASTELVGQRDLLRRSGVHRHARDRAGQLLAHALGGLHRDHVQSAVAELAGQFPGARAEIEYPRRALRQQPVHRLRRIRAGGPARRRPRRRRRMRPAACAVLRRRCHRACGNSPRLAGAGTGRAARAGRAGLPGVRRVTGRGRSVSTPGLA